jgi:hypothetical protein
MEVLMDMVQAGDDVCGDLWHGSPFVAHVGSVKYHCSINGLENWQDDISITSHYYLLPECQSVSTSSGRMLHAMLL